MAATFVLWGGPEDGKEVEIEHPQSVYYLDSPSTERGTVTGAYPNVNVQKAKYQWSTVTKRYEWKGYV